MKVLITRPRHQADLFAEALAAAGFDPIFFPVIEIRPFKDNPALDQAISNLIIYDWVIFTSTNGVELFFERLYALHPKKGNPFGIENPIRELKVAAIGPKTARALEQYGIHPDYIPNEYVAEAILPGLGDISGRKILLPRAEIARKVLIESIAAAGGIPHEIAVYQTLPAKPDPTGLVNLKTGVDIITFTSPSTVKNFIQLVRNVGLEPLQLPNHPLIACIGPITNATAKEAGYTDTLVAKEYTIEGLVEVIKQIKIRRFQHAIKGI